MFMFCSLFSQVLIYLGLAGCGAAMSPTKREVDLSTTFSGRDLVDLAAEMRQVSDVLEAFSASLEHDVQVLDDEILLVYRRLVALSESLAERLEDGWNAEP